MATPFDPTGLDIVNSKLTRLTNLIQPKLYSILLRTSPWTNQQITQVPWLDGRGATGRTAVIGGSVVDAQWKDMGETTLTSDVPLNPIPVGTTEYSFQRSETWLTSQKLDLTPLRSSFEAAQQVGGMVNNLIWNVAYSWAERYRSQYTESSTYKLVLSNSIIGLNPSGDITSFPEVAPVATVTSGLMDNLYDLLMMEHANETAAGTAQGAPVFAVFASRTAIDSITRSNTDPNNRQNVLFTEMGKGDRSYLMKQLGSTMAFRNYLYAIDSMAPRWDFDNTKPAGQRWVRIPAYVMEDTTSGQRAKPNPAYYTAPYEDLIIFNKSVMNSMVPPSLTTVGRAKFDAQSWMGDIMWVNNRDMGANFAGQVGLFAARLSNAAQVIKPRHGIVVRFARSLASSQLVSPSGDVVGSMLPGATTFGVDAQNLGF